MKTLHNRVMDEGRIGDAFRRVGNDLRDAFDAPKKYGGPDPKKKKKLKPQILRDAGKAASVMARGVTKAVDRSGPRGVTSDVDHSLFNRVYLEAEKPTFLQSVAQAAHTFHKAVDINDEDHPLGKALRKIAGLSGDSSVGGALASAAPKKISILGSLSRQQDARQKEQKARQKEQMRNARKASRGGSLFRSPLGGQPNLRSSASTAPYRGGR